MAGGSPYPSLARLQGADLLTRASKTPTRAPDPAARRPSELRLRTGRHDHQCQPPFRIPLAASVCRMAAELVTCIVTTTLDFIRPGATGSDCRNALTCEKQTQRDRLRQNRRAWHAEGQGFESP
jgi:hypothetical protein